MAYRNADEAEVIKIRTLEESKEFLEAKYQKVHVKSFEEDNGGANGLGPQKTG